MPITDAELERILAEVEENAQRAEDRGLEHGTYADIIQAQLALGAKRAIAEIRRKIGYRNEFINRLPIIRPTRSHKARLVIEPAPKKG